LFWLLDPLGHNPWPHHATISGASLGVRRTAYCRVGCLPRVALGEDKALIALLSREDARIRYSPSVHVITSGRTNGRAPGGVADTLAIRSKEPEAFCDAALEPFHTAFARALWRGRLRRLHAAGRLARDHDWPAALGLSACDVNDVPVRRCVEHHRESGLCARGQDFSTFQPGAPMPMDQPQSICVIRVPNAEQLARPRFFRNQFDPLLISIAKHEFERVDMSLKQPPQRQATRTD
jgi:hypothetical protein